MYEQTFSYEAHGQTLVIHLPKELDHHNCRNLKYETDLLLSENYINKVVFDFSRTEFMDSSGIAVVIHALRQMAQLGGRLQLQSIAEQPMKVLRAAGIEKIVEIKEAVR